MPRWFGRSTALDHGTVHDSAKGDMAHTFEVLDEELRKAIREMSFADAAQKLAAQGIDWWCEVHPVGNVVAYPTVSVQSLPRALCPKKFPSHRPPRLCHVVGYFIWCGQ